MLLLLCLFDMPYGYYQFVRLAAFIGFSSLAYFSNKLKNHWGVVICIGLAILFQPFLKIALGRSIWNCVDALVAIGLFLSLFKQSDHESSKN